MANTVNLAIPLVASNQAQKEVTVNTAITTIDAILNRGAIDRGLNTPPAMPSDGDLYIIGSAPTDQWSANANAITFYKTEWKFITPNEGMTIWVNDEDAHYTWNGSLWQKNSNSSGGGGESPIDVEITSLAANDILQYNGTNFVNKQNLDSIGQLGINTISDATNKLAVKSAAILFDNDGAGTQVKVNKATSSDTASHLFQTNYSGRAEFGLVGDDHYQVKVSSDGSNWHQAYVVSNSSGDVDFKHNVNITGSLSGVELAELDNVVISSITNGQVLKYDGTNWVNGTVSAPSSGQFTSLDITGDFTCNDNLIIRPELKDYAESKSSPSLSSGVLTLNMHNGNVFEVILTGNVTSTNFTNPPASGKGGSLTLLLRQDSTGGRTIIWPASVNWSNGSAPTLSTAANAVDILTFLTVDGGSTWYGFLSGVNLS